MPPYVLAHGRPCARTDSPWELYDLSRGRVEEQDCAIAQPERLAELTGARQCWADRCGVLALAGALIRTATITPSRLA